MATVIYGDFEWDEAKAEANIAKHGVFDLEVRCKGDLWIDQHHSVEDIGIALFEKFPAVDPLTVRFTDLREKVLGLDGFEGDPKASNEPKLEAIQMAWFEEWKDNQ